jgi:drug/metabolite transporter (DMT)-like permease
VLAVVLALLSAALFGAMTVALRFGFREGRPPDAELGALVTTAAGAVVAGIAALLDPDALGSPHGTPRFSPSPD